MKETIDKIRAACKANRTPLLFMLLFIAAFVVVNGREIAQEVSVSYSAGPDGSGSGVLTEGSEKVLTGNDSDAADGTSGTEAVDGESGDDDADGDAGADGKSRGDGADGDAGADEIAGDGESDGTAGDGAADGKSADGKSDGRSGDDNADDASGDDGSGGEGSAAGEDGDTGLTQEELSRHERRLLSQMGSSFRIPMNMPERLRSGYVLVEAAGSQNEAGRAEMQSDAERMFAERLKSALADRSGRVVLRDVSVSNALFEDGDARTPELVRSDGAVLYELEDPVMVSYLELYNWRYLRGCEVLSPEQAAWYGITVTIPYGLVEYKGKYDIYEIRDLSVLQTMLEIKTSEYDGVWSVYVKNLTSGDSFVINDNPMKSASVMKLFVMGTVYKAFESGELERTDEVMALVNNMIVNSDNESTNQLLYRLGDSDYEEGIQKVDAFIAEYGFSDMTVEYNGFENPDTVTVSGSYNQVAAKDCGKLLEDIYRRTWTSRSESNEMEQLLLSQSTRYKIPAGLPEGVLCGNKTGEMDTTENDAAVIYGEDCDYVLVVLSSDWASKDQAISRIQEISRMVYEFLN